MLIAVSAILLVLGVLAYRRALFGLGQRTRDKAQSTTHGRRMEAADVGLLVLRLVVLLLFVAVFVGAVFSRVWIERPRRVAVMLDVSKSMDAVGAESAAAAAAEGLPLPADAVRQEWTFGDTAVMREVKGQEPKAKSQIGERTRIGTALKAVGKTRPGAVLLLSDGQDNGEANAVAVAHDIGVPVYTVGYGGLAKRNAGIGQVMLPAVVYSGETVEVQVRVAAAGFADEKARVRLRGETKEIVLGQSMAEQDVPFRLVFDKPGRQVIEARVDSLMGESNYADNTRSVVVDVKAARVRVAYVTNRPGTDTRMMLRALAGDERIKTESLISISGALGHLPDSVDVFILDNVVESESPGAWQSIIDRVEAGAGALVLAGPDFQPGQNIGKVIGMVGPRQAGSFTPELTAEGGVLPWWGGLRAQSQSGTEAAGLSSVPPFVGLRPLNPRDTAHALRASGPVVWLAAQENNAPLVVAEKAGKGKVVYVAAYPLWRWGFGPEEKPEQGTPLSDFLTGVTHYLAESDTSPFLLQVDRPELYRGQPVRMTMRAVAPDGTPWTGLSVLLGAESADSDKTSRLQVPMTETGAGVYEATLEALGPGRYRAVATVENGDSTPERVVSPPSGRATRGAVPVLGRATTEFVVAEQALELANTGLNDGMLRAISEASGGRFFPSDSIPRDGSEIALGSYQRRFVFDPRRAVWAYVLIALLAGAEWFLRRRRGLL